METQYWISLLYVHLKKKKIFFKPISPFLKGKPVIVYWSYWYPILGVKRETLYCSILFKKDEIFLLSTFRERNLLLWSNFSHLLWFGRNTIKFHLFPRILFPVCKVSNTTYRWWTIVSINCKDSNYCYEMGFFFLHRSLFCRSKNDKWTHLRNIFSI